MPAAELVAVLSPKNKYGLSELSTGWQVIGGCDICPNLPASIFCNNFPAALKKPRSYAGPL
jgi:hypothetical protein